MRLRELEVLEKLAACGKLNIVLGEKGLAGRVISLLWPNDTRGCQKRPYTCPEGRELKPLP